MKLNLDFLLNEQISGQQFLAVWEVVRDDIFGNDVDLSDVYTAYEVLKKRLHLSHQELKTLCFLYYKKGENTELSELSKILDTCNEVSNEILTSLDERRLIIDENNQTDIRDDAMDILLEWFNSKETRRLAEPYIKKYNDEKKMFEVINLCLNGQFSDDELRAKVIPICKKNDNLLFCKGLLELDKSICDDREFKALLFLVNHFVHSGIRPYVGDSDASCAEGINMLIQDGMAVVALRNETDDDNERVSGCLLDVKVCRKLFLGQTDLLKLSEVLKEADLIVASNIDKKPLFYNQEDEQSVNILRDILKQEKFDSISQKLENKGHKACISALLYGGPGVGKTELVKQLAAETGRNIILADVSRLNNSHVGASEKAYRHLFLCYKYFAQLSVHQPILLFNEADGILGKRLASVNSSCDSLDNTVQTLLLQEIENMTGILFATTNLAETHLDDAFDRRFLFKVQFHNPEAKIRLKIINAMMPYLNVAIVQEIADKFAFSGGQLENISKKIDIYELAYDTIPSDETILEFCRLESLKKKDDAKSSGRIKGFMNYV